GVAHFWIVDPAGGWKVAPVEQDNLVLDRAADGQVCVHPGTEGTSAAVRILHQRALEGESWVLLSSSGIRVNGLPLTLGVRVLADRDEVLLGGTGRVFFSTERLARVEPFPGSERPVFCPRCRQPIDGGCAAVKCPQCGVTHHQS